MTIQTINVGTVANDGTGDTERAAWGKANANFAEINKLSLNALGARKLSVCTLGESHGLGEYLGAAIQYACWRYYNADISFDHRSFVNGGQVFAIAGSTTNGTTPRGLALQVTDFATRPAEIAFIASGYNDQPGTGAAAITVANNVIAAANTLLSTGALLVVITSIHPRATAGSAVAWATYNKIIENFARVTPGVRYLNVAAVLNDPQNGSTAPFRNIVSNPLGTYQSYTIDGTHLSGYAIRAIAPLIADIFRRVAPLRYPRNEFNNGAYDPANSPYINMLGDAGGIMGTSGFYNGAADPGVAGIDSTSRIMITPSGGVTATPSIITGANGERIQRLVLGGTSSSGLLQVSITPTITTPNNGDATRTMDFEAAISLTNIVGLTHIRLRPTSATYDTLNTATSDSSPSNRWTDGSSEDLFCYSLYPAPVPGTANPVFNIMFAFTSGGVPVSGTIDISKISAMLTKPIA